MAYSQADLDQLQSNMAKGIQSAVIDGEQLTFRSLDEMERLERKLKLELGTTAPARVAHVATTRSGW